VYYLFPTLAMLWFSVIVFYSAIEIALYSLYRKKMIAAFEVNKKIVGSQYSFWWFVSCKPSHLARATILYVLCICTHSWARTNDTKIRALIRRVVKQGGPNKKVWCSRLGSAKTSRFCLLTLELRLLKKFHETPFYMEKDFGAFLFWGNGKRWVF